MLFFFRVSWIKEIVVPISENYLKEAEKVMSFNLLTWGGGGYHILYGDGGCIYM